MKYEVYLSMAAPKATRAMRTFLTSRWLTYVLALVAVGLFFAYLGRVGHWGAFEWWILSLALVVIAARFVFLRLW